MRLPPMQLQKERHVAGRSADGGYETTEYAASPHIQRNTVQKQKLPAWKILSRLGTLLVGVECPYSHTYIHTYIHTGQYISIYTHPTYFLSNYLKPIRSYQ